MRVLKRSIVAAALGVNTVVLSCPAGHKFEVVDVAGQSDLVGQYTYYWAITSAPFPAGFSQLDVVPPKLFMHDSCQGFIVHAGETLVVFCASARPNPGVAMASYVDVSPV